MSAPTTALLVCAAVGGGLVAGTFAAFSGFVMPALRQLPTASAVAAVQQVNLAAVRPPLMTALFGTAAAALAAPVLAWRSRLDPDTQLLVAAGSGLYLLGVVGVTIAGNVPLNEWLAVQAADAVADPVWQDWERRWTARNTVRSVAGVAATLAWTLAVRRTG